MRYMLIVIAPMLLLAGCESDSFQNGAFETQSMAQGPTYDRSGNSTATLGCAGSGCETATLMSDDVSMDGYRDEAN